MMNPFNQIENESLCNIVTGESSYLYTAEVLLTVNVTKCIKRPKRFEERIAKQKKQAYETELGKKIRDPKGKVFAACILNNLFGRQYFVLFFR